MFAVETKPGAHKHSSLYYGLRMPVSRCSLFSPLVFAAFHRFVVFFFFSSRRRHTRYWRDWSSDVCSSDLHDVHAVLAGQGRVLGRRDPFENERDRVRVLEALDVVPRERRLEIVARRALPPRSEERRVGKEGRSRGSAEHENKKVHT